MITEAELAAMEAQAKSGSVYSCDPNIVLVLAAEVRRLRSADRFARPRAELMELIETVLTPEQIQQRLDGRNG